MSRRPKFKLGQSLKERHNWRHGPGIAPLAIAVWGMLIIAGFALAGC